MIRKLALAALAVQLAGCASIDTINGVRMNASTAPDATYCDRNPTLCILLSAGAIGGLGAIFLANRNHHAPAPQQRCQAQNGSSSSSSSSTQICRAP